MRQYFLFASAADFCIMMDQEFLQPVGDPRGVLPLAWRCLAWFLFAGVFPGLAVATVPTEALEGRAGPLVVLWTFGLGLGCWASVGIGTREEARAEVLRAQVPARGARPACALLQALPSFRFRLGAALVACAAGTVALWCARNSLSRTCDGAGADCGDWLPRVGLASDGKGIAVSSAALIVLALVWALAFGVEGLRGRECPSADSAPALHIERGEMP